MRILILGKKNPGEVAGVLSGVRIKEIVFEGGELV